MDRWGLVLVVCCASGCYAGGRAERGVNHAWTGRSRATIEARWGRPGVTGDGGGGMTALRWSHTNRHIELPKFGAGLHVEPGVVEGHAEFEPGRIWTSTTVVTALVDARGTIAAIHGPSLRWGAPNDANLRWGVIFGAHAGAGGLDDTGTPLPSGGAYIGGMLSPTLGLVGCFTMATGIGDGGGAMGFGWGVAAQYWPMTRLWLRGGPALILDLDPGFADPTLAPGVTTGLGFALIKAGSFVLDLRADAVGGPGVAFATLGIGVNVN